MSWLGRFFRRKRKSVRKASPRSVPLTLEVLEDRLAPIVGAYTVPPEIAPLAPVQPASQYDGVVNINPGPRGITGSLIQTGTTGWGFGHQILMAAHAIALGAAVPIKFDLQRAGTPVPVVINVPANVPGGAQYQIPHSTFGAFEDDIGLVVLVDQVNPAPNRLLVAPFTAQQYTLYGDAGPVLPEVGQQFTMVGYGLTGRGALGANMPLGTKRAGHNRFDSDATPWEPDRTMALMYDFDRLNDPDGRPNIDPLGFLYPALGLANAGLFAAEAMAAPGDSGGPAFVGANVIAGVLSSRASPGRPPDIDKLTNSSFGELGFVTNVRMTIGDPALQSVLNPGSGAKYHLVLDMNQQVLGLDGVKENITITAQRSADGANLELVVSGSGDGTLNGTYYSAPAANIASLTIRGSDDNETIRLLGKLNVGPITIEARRGNNTIVVGDPFTGNLNDVTNTISINNEIGGYSILEVNDPAAPAGRDFIQLYKTGLNWNVASTGIFFENLGSLTLRAGNEGNTIFVTGTDFQTTTTISTGMGTDSVYVGRAFVANDPSSSLVGSILGNLVVNGCDGIDRLIVNDRGGATATYTVTDTTVKLPGSGTITYSCLDELTVLGSGGAPNGNIINVESTATGTTTKIDAGDGLSHIKVASGAPNPNSLDDIKGELTVGDLGVGQIGFIDIIIDDSGSLAGRVYEKTADGVTYVGGQHIWTQKYKSRLIREAKAPQGMGALGNRTEILSAQAGALDLLETGDNDDVITFALTEPLQNANVTIDGGLGRDQVVVAQGLVSTDQVTLLNTEDLEVSGDGFSPGGLTALASFTVPEDYLQTTDGTLYMELGPSSTSDRLSVDGTVTLDGTLDLGLLPGFSGTDFLLIDNTGSDAVCGTFDGLSEGDEIQVAGWTFEISYEDGDGNDVTLTLVGQPSLWGRVFTDNDGNGLQGSGDSGSDGVSVALLDNMLQTVATTTTANSGFYSFAGVANGTYTIAVTAPSGFYFTTQNVGSDDSIDSDVAPATGRTSSFTFNANQPPLAFDAGLYEKGALSGRVSEDSNGNGLRNSGEPDVASITVDLLNALGSTIASTSTASDGSYQFTDLVPGSYSVRFVQGANLILTLQNVGNDESIDSDPNSSTGLTVVTVSSGQSISHVDAGVHDPLSIAGNVWTDSDGNGIRDTGESGLDGVSVALRNSLLQTIATTTTANGGDYFFGNLSAGSYTVAFTAPSGQHFTLQAAGSDDTIDSDASPLTGWTAALTLWPDYSASHIDAGLYQYGSISGLAWTDSNGDGLRGSGDSGRANVSVELLTASGSVLTSTTSASDGSYQFANLVPGNYSVRLGMTTNLSATLQDVGNDETIDSDIDPTTLIVAVAATSGQTTSHIDLGLYVPVTVQGNAWIDANADGIRDTMEMALSGLAVTLRNSDGTFIASTFTDLSGNYSFSGVAPGNDYVVFSKPAGMEASYNFSPQDQGGNDTLDSDADATGMTAYFTLLGGELKNNLDAGLVPVGGGGGGGGSGGGTGTISGRAWIDGNANGIQDSGETGLSGVPVSLYTSTGTLVGTTATTGGLYSFFSVAAGNYDVLFSKPAGMESSYNFSSQDQGGNDTLDSDIDLNGLTAYFTLASGPSSALFDAGLIPL